MADSSNSESPQYNLAYSNYVLVVLTIVYIFNFIDRQILSILNEHIKADLGMSDAEMGFLYGTAFALFYATFGIALGRLADVWVRRSLIAWSLAFWSAATALSGLTRNFFELAVARIGVGVGEAGATPAAFSMLSDYFPVARRATVLAIYTSGVFVGVGIGLMIGGGVVERWDNAFGAGDAPFGLRGWQVAFFVVGLPGLLMAVWVRSLREPKRGQMDGIETPEEPHPFREFGRELRAVIPPFTWFHLRKEGASKRALVTNLLAAAGLALAAYGLIQLTGDSPQWVAVAVGVYATVSWFQALGLRDPPSARLILRSPSLQLATWGVGALAFSLYAIGYWTAPLFLRFHNLDISQVGLMVGGTAAAGGFIGATLGGVLADAWRKRTPRGRLYQLFLGGVLPVPLLFGVLYLEDTRAALFANFLLNVCSTLWVGAGASTIQDLVLPRMRATASAFYILVTTLAGLALGPYFVGQLSDATGDLRKAMLLGLLGYAVGAILFAIACRYLARDEETLLSRARAAGEVVVHTGGGAG